MNATNHLKMLLADEEYEGFEDKLRTLYEWDNEKFEELLQIAESCCVETEGHELIPRWLADFFCSMPSYIIGISSHPDFIENQARCLQISKEETKRWLEEKHKKLKYLKLWFFCGKKPPENIY